MVAMDVTMAMVDNADDAMVIYVHRLMCLDNVSNWWLASTSRIFNLSMLFSRVDSSQLNTISSSVSCFVLQRILSVEA